ncbi:MAG: two-component system response regulator [Pseudomonadales bacterium RIFCSPLOWO2_12_59_9]|uniref:HD domain-containing phosphohydrolase n=1 Tax=Pseudomonas sp. TaxID=306 RepID=UPI0008D8B08D|nr:response regulator [Pseudomonas sp.]OHC28158.1 MAG: two-component system response regulator [Pseudomonadales bacterium RIFCSPLOWO2_12_59_9]
MSEATIAAKPQQKILLVDDEEAILNSLRRVLRNQPYELFFAQGGEDALLLLEKHAIDVVVSDARMPGMDGATLLSEVNKRKPDCMTILLTGYAEINTIVKAINEGQIYRYISKPWNDEELLMTLRQALAMQHAERERRRLVVLTRRQNEALRELNENLEARVKDRTAELQQTADMLDLAYDELQRSYVTSTEVFSMLINQRLPRDKQTNQQVILLVRAFCANQHIDDHSSRDIAMAAALYNIGKLSWSDELISSPSDLLYRNERDTYRKYPAQSESLLMALEPLRDAATLIRHHQEHWDGGGFPDHIKEQQIPFGARLLKLAIDFVELQCGLVLERKMNRDEALLFIRKYSGRLYDPEMVELFIQVCAHLLADIRIADPAVKALDTRHLEPGMILARNLQAENGMLLLNEGKELNRQLIDKLIAFESIEAVRYTVFVVLPEPQP